MSEDRNIKILPFVELTTEVLLWWEKHQYDTDGIGDDERNRYDETPEFVKKAQECQKQLDAL